MEPRKLLPYIRFYTWWTIIFSPHSNSQIVSGVIDLESLVDSLAWKKIEFWPNRKFYLGWAMYCVTTLVVFQSSGQTLVPKDLPRTQSVAVMARAVQCKARVKSASHMWSEKKLTLDLTLIVACQHDWGNALKNWYDNLNLALTSVLKGTLIFFLLYFTLFHGQG